MLFPMPTFFGTDNVPAAVEMSSMEDRPRGLLYTPVVCGSTTRTCGGSMVMTMIYFVGSQCCTAVLYAFIRPHFVVSRWVSLFEPRSVKG